MMDCNKEEAIRAKGIAESKMQSKDFMAARKFALKAQQLYKDLENISQMLTVCDVHCAADAKLFGNEMDWYGILQIEETADQSLIKKQYRKFALQLHPDKNRFPGAEAAFKLIGEAQRVLLDKGKRSLHDVKRKASMSKAIPPHKHSNKTIFNMNYGAQNNYCGNFTYANYQQQQPPQGAARQAFPNARATFWTGCPFCNVKYQYYIEVMNKSLLCQSCGKSFVAYEKSSQGATTTNYNRAAFAERKTHQGTSKMENWNQGTVNGEHPKTEFSQKQGCNAEFNSQKENRKRRRKEDSESSENCDTDSNTDSEDDILDEDGDFKAKVKLESHGEGPRRSGRRKQQVSYNENVSDDDEKFVTHSKKAKGSEPSFSMQKTSALKGDGSKTTKQSGHATNREDENEFKQVEGEESLHDKEMPRVKREDKVEENSWKESFEAHSGSTSDPCSQPKSVPEIYAFDEPDFNDFEKGRKEECFSEGQVWALYDTVDAMPRFYAIIRKVFSPGFKLRITWLEPVPDDKCEIEWIQEGLPISCGKYTHGKSQTSDQQLMFSHVISWEKDNQGVLYKIFPRQGEIWALFKNWDIKWKLDADTNRKYEYEFVELLSDYSEAFGACVAYLQKLKGFVSVFCRVSKDSFKIPSAELLRFSHMVPSFKLAGKEREGIPKGSFELDPASLPQNIEEFVIPEDLGVDVANSVPIDLSSKSCSGEVKYEEEFEASTSAHEASADLKEAHLGSDINDGIEIPEAEFFDFDDEKTIDKFEVGQIWSLYSDEDGLPKYYGRIAKISSTKGYKLHLRWLASCPSKYIHRWSDDNMLVCCGRFRVEKGKLDSFTSTNLFSHQVTVEGTTKKDEYDILPVKGQVWALYRDWSLGIKHSELDKCEYDVVEVLETLETGIKVLHLERVNGFNSVFKPELKESSTVRSVIPHAELLRFSHQIPSFRLTDERNGSLRDFWELDPAALPLYYFNMS
ncbi:hypothetical protein K2173_017594 [Erythroxylum novogranatense]|uniref:J domain-containing protein n=1 Tax=Erythroxylum novogranatense TaxID=1862640 RepID=A0AAV8TMR3_9ROSI|nr:hypothetical protein K2173_017594 [Erythroxylum novogranatense]